MGNLSPSLPPLVGAALALLTSAVYAALAGYSALLLIRLRAILREPKTSMLSAFVAVGAWHAAIAGADALTGAFPGAAHAVAVLLTGAVLLRIVRRTAVSSRSWTADPPDDPVM